MALMQAEGASQTLEAVTVRPLCNPIGQWIPADWWRALEFAHFCTTCI